jgi:uroporphyrinogen decarboxylase
MKNNRFLRAICKQPVDATPIWVMRQAGRYLPEYRATRARAGSFLNLCKTPELACEVTLQPIQRYPLDAAIIFSDILTIPDAMGLGLEFVENEGPLFRHPIQQIADIQRLHVPDLQHLSYVYEAIHLTQQALAEKIPLIGFCGSPWTLAAYMVEGRGKTGFPLVLQLLQEEPLFLHNLLDILAKSVTAHLNAQIVAGVNAVMLFDTWGGLLNTAQYTEFSLNYLHQVISGLQKHYNNKMIPVVLFTKDGSRWLEPMAKIGCDVLGVDWKVSLQEARARVGEKVALQGNLDPACLMEPPEMIQQAVQRTLDSYGHGSGHVFNLGHGITPEVPPEHMQVLIEAVHEQSKFYHRQG